MEDQQAVLGTRLLVVDDIGTERYRVLFTSILCELIDARQGVRRKTILTSNLTREQIEQRYPDDRLRSRLNQQAAFIGNDGPDMRRRSSGFDEARDA